MREALIPKLDGCLCALVRLFQLRGRHLLEHRVSLSLQGKQDRSMDFQVREYERLIDKVPDSTLQTSF